MNVTPPQEQGDLYGRGAAVAGDSASNRFGGAWTKDKPAVLREYLEFSTIAPKGRFDLIHIDTFAGTGRCQVRVSASEERVIDGSATIALNTDPPFECLHFIERSRTAGSDREAAEQGDRPSRQPAQSNAAPFGKPDEVLHRRHTFRCLSWSRQP